MLWLRISWKSVLFGTVHLFLEESLTVCLHVVTFKLISSTTVHVVYD